MPILKRAAETILIALLYFLSGKLGQTMAIPPGNVTPVWPPSGIALALLLLLGNWRALPGLFVGAFFVNLAFFDGATDVGAVANAFATGIGIALGSVLQPLLGVYLIQRFVDQGEPLERIQSFLTFLAIIPVMCLISASVGTTSLVLGGFAPLMSFGEIWPTWWLGDSVGVLVAAPLLLAWWQNLRIETTPADVLETLAIFVGLFGTSWIAFASQSQAPLAFLPVPVLLWAGLRLDLRGVVLAILTVEALAIWSTLQGLGPFHSENLNDSLLLIQLFIAVFTTTTLIVAIFVQERDAALVSLQQARQDQFAQMVEGLGGKYFYYAHNTLGEFTYVSESIQKILGYTPEEFKRHFENFLPETPLNQTAVAYTERSIRGEQQPIYEIDVFHKDGRVRRIEVFERPIFDDEGVVVGVEGMSCDITDRIAEGEKFERLLNSAPDGMIISDDQGKITLVNTRTEEMFGYNRDELIGEVVEILMPKDVRVHHPRLRTDFVSQPNTRPMGIGRDLFAERKDGSVFPVEISLSPIETEDGILISAAVRDITERKQAEEALTVSENRLNLAMDTSGVGLWDFNTQTGETYLSPQYFTMLGYGARELSQGYETWQTLLHPEDRKCATEQFDEFVSGGKKYEIYEDEYRMVTKTGEDRWILARGGVVERDEQSNPVRIIGTHVDITERKRSQEILASRNLELVAARDEAEQAARAAEAANQAKSVFLANMSHEIRTPMNAILGFSDILSGMVSEPQQKEYIDSIQASGKSLLTLINDILDLSKVEAGEFELENEPVALENIFLDMKQVFGDQVAEKKLAFDVVLGSNLPDVVVLDGSRLRQVLTHVIGNAVKFTDKGHVKLRVQSEYKETDIVDLTIDVEDTGIGIPTDQQEVIFGAFSQREGQSINQYGGTGLGLAITKRLVEMMKGQIAVSSQVGVGSIFRVRLNDIQVASLEALAEKSKTEIDVASIVFEPATLLIADDIITNRDLIKGFVQKYPFQVLEAEDGQQAIDMMRQHRPDIILMDIKMPVLDGYAATKMIRRDMNFKDLVVIALTESDIRETEAEINDVCNGFIEKPLSKEALIAELVQYLSHTMDTSDKVEIQEDVNHLEFSEEIQARFPELINELENRREACENLALTLTINDVEDFAQEMQQLAKAYQYQPLLMWGEKLLLQATTFDMDGISDTLGEYDELITGIGRQVADM